MSELQIALIVVGIAVLVAVVLFNRWQEKKARERAEGIRAHTDAALAQEDRRLERQAAGSEEKTV